MDTWFGSSAGTLGFVVLSTVAIYATTVACVRVAGRRTVAQMSAFDAVVTVALGSLLATTAVSSEVSYVEGTVALTTLLALQVAVAWVRRRSRRFRRLVEFEPEVLNESGQIRLPTGVLSSQMTMDELRSQLRQHGISDPSRPALVLLEPDGKSRSSTPLVPPARVARRRPLNAEQTRTMPSMCEPWTSGECHRHTHERFLRCSAGSFP